MSIRELLIETFVHMPPMQILEGLSSDDAVRVPMAGLHAIASIVGHMEFWQSWFLKRCEGQGVAMPGNAAEGWPAVTADQWLDLLARFESGLAHAVSLGDDRARLDAPVTPAIEFPPLAHYTVRDALMHMAQHNSHHLGQIVTARQILGCWPPPAGSFTW
jgi:uncharacterized damage-inducible protein DinB